MIVKRRLDQAMVELGLAENLDKAKAFIMGGLVYVENQKSDKPGTIVKKTEKIELRNSSPKYVSRGGLKLEKAMKEFPIDLNEKVCMDVGASTGGFTDCMIQNGAKRVYSVDVGYGQLAWSLRTNEKVVNLERSNARYLTKEQVPDEVDFVSIDVSFISLKIILPAIYHLLSENAKLVCLIKPQFEASRDQVGKKGVVRDKNVHLEVCSMICDFAKDNGYNVLGLSFSPIKGPEGNIEYLVFLQKNVGECHILEIVNPSDIVEKSHNSLDKM